jgi:hypothetical protein
MFTGNEKALSVFLRRYTEDAILIAKVVAAKVESQWSCTLELEVESIHQFVGNHLGVL